MQDRRQCIEAGMNDYLAKPVKKSEMESILLKWLPTVEIPAAITPLKRTADASPAIVESVLVHGMIDDVGVVLMPDSVF